MIEKGKLIYYLLSEINDLEPKDAYYADYYKDFINKDILFGIYDWKKLFIEELNTSDTEYIVEFMKRNCFIDKDLNDENINSILLDYCENTKIYKKKKKLITPTQTKLQIIVNIV